VDPLLILTQLTLSALGVLGVATSAPDAWLGQAARALVGIAITMLVAHVPPRTVVKLSPFAYVTMLLLLIAVLFIGSSPSGSESHRWILIGSFSLQPSELMKVTVIAYLTAFFYNHLGNWQLWRPMFVIGLAAGAILLEPDISTALFIFVLALAIMFAAGTSVTRLVSITTAAAFIAVLFAGSYLSQFSYISERISGFSDLWGSQEQSQTTSYQALQAQRTLVRAGLFGLGPGRPMSVPEADTDMISISIGHALGLLGIATLFTLYFLVAFRGIRIASSLAGPGSLLAAGATTYICGQAALNLLVASGLLPVTGIPLPFVSYGLNSLVSVSIATGFIHSAYRQAKAEGIDV
jgi:cell division protein FtsW